ncbi:alpha/beta hydrolase [Palleronia rufa]|uniref:alpha/beta hydrolase n=1 Tax=Palleronia rufa TaxID=1530186 RepID=UPI00056BD7C7|nr:alpha/beta hydrolase [Palleronia rufa]
MRLILRLLVVLAVLGGIAWVALPRAQMGPMPGYDSVALGDDLDAWLAAREARFDDIVPGTEARIRWAGTPGAQTDWALVYLHGFSASAQEIRPVPEDVARALGANLYYARFAGHGRDGAAMAEASADDWARDTAQAVAVARRLGKRVAVISTSTGGTLAAIAAAEIGGVDAMVMISPNFGPRNPAAPLLNLPGARWWIPLIAGETRSFEPVNDAQARYWTERYPTVAVLPMQAAVDRARAADLGGTDIPALVIYSEADEVVRPDATRTAMADWGGTVSWVRLAPGPGVDPSAHVLAGDILSPALTARVTDRILAFLQDL